MQTWKVLHIRLSYAPFFELDHSSIFLCITNLLFPLNSFMHKHRTIWLVDLSSFMHRRSNIIDQQQLHLILVVIEFTQFFSSTMWVGCVAQEFSFPPNEAPPSLWNNLNFPTTNSYPWFYILVTWLLITFTLHSKL